MDVFADIEQRIRRAVSQIGPSPDLSRVMIESPRNARHGDLSTNAALVVASALSAAPRDIAAALAAMLAEDPDIVAASAEAPGFVNVTLSEAYWRAALAGMVAAGERYGHSAIGAGLTAELEYPTAIEAERLDLDRFRAAVIAEARETLLAAVGYDLKRIPDARTIGAPMVRLSRAGTSAPGLDLWDVAGEVGADALRFTMLMAKAEASLELDLARMSDPSKDNPVFLVQYAHARAARFHRAALAAPPGVDSDATPGHAPAVLADPMDGTMLKRVAGFPRMVERAAQTREPSRVAAYLYETARDFHGILSPGKDQPHLRFINDDARQSMSVQLALVRAIELVLANGLRLLGVSAPGEMR